MRADKEVDFHHYTRSEMLVELQNCWASRSWHGLRRVRIIHGTGAVLWRELRRWCDEKGIQWAPEPANPGCTIIYPSQQAHTVPAPPHRPLARQKRRLETLIDPPKPRSAGKASPAPEPPVSSEDETELFARELDRLEKVDPRVLRRKKLD